MTVQNILDKIRYIANIDSNDATDAQLLRLINDGVSSQVEFVSNLRQDFLLKAGTAINLVAGTSDYTLATDVLQLKKLMLKLDGSNTYPAYEKDLNLVTELNTETEHLSSPKYSKLTQTAATEFIVRIYPTPTANVTNGLTYFYIQRPAALTTGSETPVTPPELHPALVQYALRDLKQRTGDIGGMRAAENLVAMMQEDYKRQVGTRNIDVWEGFETPSFTE